MKRPLFFLACLLCVGKAFAQKEVSLWYVHDGAGLAFTKTGVVEKHDSKMNAGTLRGNITLCDSTGKLVFYSDGISVWNGKHQRIAQDLRGDLNISAVPHSNRQGVYWLFYTGRQDNPASYPLHNDKKRKELERAYLAETEKKSKAKLYYSLLDMNTQTFLEKDVLLLDNAVGDVALARHAEAGKYWLQAHEADSDTFLAYRLDADGLNKTPVATKIGKVYPAIYDYTMKTTIKGDRTVLDKVGVDTGCEVFDFDNQTGKFTQLYAIIHNDNAFFVWNYEFSPNGRYLYSVHLVEDAATDEFLNYKEIDYNLFRYDLEAYNQIGQTRILKTPIYSWEMRTFVSDHTLGVYASNRYNTQLQIAPNGWLMDITSWVIVGAITKPNAYISPEKLTAMKSIESKRALFSMVRLKMFPKKFGGKMPKINHLLSLGLCQDEQDIKVGEPFMRPVLFETGLATLKKEYESELQDIVAFLKDNPKLVIEISGHTDNVGKEADNQRLSENRAKSLATFLTSQGIEATRIKTAGFGSSKPLVPNTSPEAQARNRRIEFLIK